MNYAPLYIKTDNSLLKSMIKINDLIMFAKKNNYKSLTITDDNLCGAMEFYNSCLKNDIKPIIGLELKTENETLVLYAKDIDGYYNLVALASQQNTITVDELEKYSKNLICIIPFEYRSSYQEFNKLFSNIYIGIKNKDEYNHCDFKNIVYMNESLCLKETDNEYTEYLTAIKEGLKLDSFKYKNNDNYIKSYDYISKNYPLTLKQNEEIVKLCNVKIEKRNDLLPVYPCPNNMNSYEYLKELTILGLKKNFGDKAPLKYIERLKYELEVIKKMGFCDYFLIVWDYVKYAKDNNILVGPGRGSAAGSLVSFCLNITTIDPIKYDLLFERFLNPNRITMPDIDIDFDYIRREEVINYCIEKYGAKKVAGIITFATLGSKQAIRDVGRVIDMDLNEVDHICKMIDSKLSLKQNYDSNLKLKTYLEKNKKGQDLFKISSKLEGLKRQSSSHACGVVICFYDLDLVIPIYKHDNIYLTGYSMNYLEDLGLLKMDFLGLKNLTLIDDLIKDINSHTNSNLSFDSIPLNDEKTLKIFEEANTLGIFQFESKGMMNFIRKFKPNSLEDLFAAIALYRPGPMDNIDSYIRRKQGKEKIEYIDECLEKILSPTYGIIIYQEQIMSIASEMAGYTMSEADLLRRAVSKKKEEILKQEKNKFISGCMKNGHSLENSTKVYDLILKFASYGFNKSHSVAYAIIAYKMAYLKAYYREYFMKNLLNMVIGSSTSTKDYIYECKLNKIDLLKPSINLSGSLYSIQDLGIRYPLINIKNIGTNAVNVILESRVNNNYTDIFDFVRRTYGPVVNRKVLESLIYAGCFDSLGFNKKTLINNLDIILNYADICKDMEDDSILKPVLEIEEEFSKKELMEQEIEIFGFYLSNHPVTEKRLELNSNITINNIPSFYDKVIDLIVRVGHLKELNTKNNEQMCFIEGEDEIGNLDIVLFPKTYEQYKGLKIGNIIKVNGKIEKRYDKYQMIVNKIDVLE